MKLALGTVQMGLNYGVANSTGRVSVEQTRCILKRARESGIDTLDTAIAYGESELVLGRLDIQPWKIVTKLPAVPDSYNDVTQWVRQQTLASLNRLQVRRLYGLLLHHPGQLLENRGHLLYEALQAVKADGLVAKVGVSVYCMTELALLFETYIFDLVQAPLNILDRRLVDLGWVTRLKFAGIELHTRSAFLQGLLLMPADKRPYGFKRWAEVFQEWDRWLAKTGLSPLQACLRYVNSIPTVDRVVVGVDTIDQLNQIIDAVDGMLVSLPEFKALQDDRLINPATWDNL